MVVSVEFTALDRTHCALSTGEPPLSWVWYIVCAYSVFAFICNLGREIIKDMEDVEGDTKAGCHTLVIELGPRYSKIVVTLIECALLTGCGLALNNIPSWISMTRPTSFFIALIAMPTIALCILVWKGDKREDMHRASILSKAIMAAGMLSVLFLN